MSHMSRGRAGLVVTAGRCVWSSSGLPRRWLKQCFWWFSAPVAGREAKDDAFFSAENPNKTALQHDVPKSLQWLPGDQCSAVGTSDMTTSTFPTPFPTWRPHPDMGMEKEAGLARGTPGAAVMVWWEIFTRKSRMLSSS